jgi:hypothetical protein
MTRPIRSNASKIGAMALMAGALAALLCGCLKSSGLAGGTSETTNGEYTARVAYADGRPAAKSLVLLIEEGDWSAKVAEGGSIILDSARTGADGLFRVKLPAGHRCNLQIDLEGEALFAREFGIDSDQVSAPRLMAAPTASLSGHARSESDAIREVRLAGTAYVSTVGADGAYAFPRIAPGTFLVVAVMNKDGASLTVPLRTVELRAGENRVGIDTVMVAARVMANNFEQDFWYQTQLGQTAGGGWSASRSGTGTIQSLVSSDSLLIYSGKSLLTDIVFRKDEPASSARVGFSLDASINLARMTGISLYAKGNGRVYLRFHSRALNALTGDSVQFQAPIDLGPGWTRVRIPVESLALTPNAPVAAQGFAWSDAARDILAVEFTALPDVPAGADSAAQAFGLDDFSFDGVTLQDLRK